MQIKYVGGMGQVLLGEIRDPRYNSFLQNETKDVPDYEIDVADHLGHAYRLNAIYAVLNHGPHFVDAATGKNPLFVCSNCGEDALSEFFKPADDRIEYATSDGEKLCVACYLIANPRYVEYHMAQGHYGLPNETRIKLIAAGIKVKPWATRPAKRSVRKAPVSDRTIVAPATVAPPPAPIAPTADEDHASA